MAVGRRSLGDQVSGKIEIEIVGQHGEIIINACRFGKSTRVRG